MLNINDVPARASIAAQLEAINANAPAPKTLPKRERTMCLRVQKAIAEGERVRGVELVRRIADQGVSESTARWCIYSAIDHGVLVSEGSQMRRIYWRSDKVLN